MAQIFSTCLIAFAASAKTADAGVPSLDSSAGDVVTTPSGLQYQDIVVGDGPAPKKRQIVRVQYTGMREDGFVFDTSVNKERPYDFVLGQYKVLKGWEEGILGMHVGGKRRLIIPPPLAFGDKGARVFNVPPNTTVIYDIELLSAQKFF